MVHVCLKPSVGWCLKKQQQQALCLITWRRCFAPGLLAVTEFLWVRRLQEPYHALKTLPTDRKVGYGLEGGFTRRRRHVFVCLKQTRELFLWRMLTYGPASCTVLSALFSRVRVTSY